MMETNSTGAERVDRDAIDNRVRRLVSILAIGILGACAALSLSARANRDEPLIHTYQEATLDADTPLPPAPSRAVVAGQVKQPPETLPGLCLTLTRRGFQPSKVVRPAGRFALAVVSRTGLDSLSFSMDRANGAQLRAKQLQRESPHWVDVYDLAPGRYTLRETSHPDWVCEIIIE
jgi:hypothetical protein